MAKTERLYLDSWNYNVARVLTALHKVVENYGGSITSFPFYHDKCLTSWQPEKYLLTNRSISEYIRREEANIERAIRLCADHGKIVDGSKAKADLAAYKEKYLSEAENPIECTHLQSISFIYDGKYYYYSVDHNPLFPFRYQKANIENGKLDINIYGEECKKQWVYDCLWTKGCSQADIVEIAHQLFNALVSYPNSGKVTKKRRVYYGKSYCYENYHESHMLTVEI